MNLFLWDYLELCTAKLELGGSRSLASGTLIAPGLLVTCSHVVAESRGSMRVLVEGQEVAWSLQADLKSPYPDLALLQIELEQHHWVRLDSNVRPGDSLYTFGYTDEMPLGDTTTGRLEGWSNLGPGRNLKFKEGQVRPGLSGAPLLNLRTLSVCGIVRTTRDRRSDLGGRAVSASQVIELVGQDRWRNLSKAVLSKAEAWNAAARLTEGADSILGSTVLRGSLEAAEFFCGREADLDKLEHFCVGDDPYVMALVGVGGSGKTALVRQFLGNKGWLRDREIGTGPTVFVWSFYDYPSTSEFLQAANDYFIPGNDGKLGTVDRLLESLRAVKSQTILVLDGLEKVQAPGEDNGVPRGSLEDPTLRHLLLSISDGDAPSVKLIVTSRFPLTDFSARPATGYQELALDDLDPNAARELLSRLGVRGDLETIIRDFGRHALTLDLLGRLLAEFFNGYLPADDVMPPLSSLAGTPSVEKQSNRLSRVLAAYLRYLRTTEVELLQRISLFRRPIESQFIFELIYVSAGGKLSGSLMTLTEYQKQAELRRLISLRLVTKEVSRDSLEVLTCHPAVRDYFYSSIEDAGGLHSAVRDRLVSLVDQPGRDGEPAPLQLDLLEELIYHTVKLGRKEEAFKIYRERLGYLRLGWERGDHSRGASVLRMIDEGKRHSSRTSWLPQHATRFAIDFALYLKNLGALDEAISILESMRDEVLRARASQDIPSEERALILQNLSAILVQRGWLPEGEKIAREAVGLTVNRDEDRLIHDCRVRLAACLAIQGKVDDAEEEFARASSLNLKGDKVVREVLSVRYAWLLRRLGRTDEALEMLKAEKELYSGLQYGIIVARLDVVLAETLADLGRPDEGLVALEGVFRWISTGADQEMVVAGHVARARLALAAGDLLEVASRADRARKLSEKYGYITYWVDALLLSGWARLAAGDVAGAVSFATLALEGGDSGTQGLMRGATDPRVRYYWGEDEAMRLKARVGGIHST